MRTLFLLCLLAVAASAQTRNSGPWELEDSGTTAGLRGIHAVGGGVVWASGTDGTVIRSEDTGYLWQQCTMPPGASKLDFRGIWAWDAQNALVLASGPGDLSRLLPDNGRMYQLAVGTDKPRCRPRAQISGLLGRNPLFRPAARCHLWRSRRKRPA